MEIIGEFLGYAGDKQIWQYFNGHWRHFFPAIPTEELAARSLYLQTPVRENMTENRPATFLAWMMSKRRLVETVIGQLSERFQIEKNGHAHRHEKGLCKKSISCLKGVA